MSDAVYSPVTGPTNSGTDSRTRDGSSAPAMAIPMPASAVPGYSANARRKHPAAMAATDRVSTHGIPNRRPSAAATGANSPMQTTGSVVSAPAPTVDSASEADRESTMGGTDEMTGRRLAATRATATSHSHETRRVNPRPRPPSPR